MPKRTPVFAPRQLVYVEKPLIKAFSVKYVEKIAKKTYNKHMSKTMGCFPITKVSEHTLVIEENGIRDMTSIQKATLTPGRDSTLVPSSKMRSL